MKSGKNYYLQCFTCEELTQKQYLNIFLDGTDIINDAFGCLI